jgi:Flp pilus assembly protein TadD
LEALRLSPGDEYVSSWLLHVGRAKAFLGDFEAAAVWLRKSLDANRSNPWAIFELAACLAQLGRLDEALDEMKSGLAVFPKFTIARYRAGSPKQQ